MLLNISNIQPLVIIAENSASQTIISDLDATPLNLYTDFTLLIYSTRNSIVSSGTTGFRNLAFDILRNKTDLLECFSKYLDTTITPYWE